MRQRGFHGTKHCGSSSSLADRLLELYRHSLAFGITATMDIKVEITRSPRSDSRVGRAYLYT